MSLSFEKLKRYHETAFDELEILNKKYSQQLETKKNKRQKLKNEIEKLKSKMSNVDDEIDKLRKIHNRVFKVFESKKGTEEEWDIFCENYKKYNHYVKYYNSSEKIQNSYFRLSKNKIDEIKNICVQANMIFHKYGRGEFTFTTSNYKLYYETKGDVLNKIRNIVPNISSVSSSCNGEQNFSVILARNGPPLSYSHVKFFSKQITHRYNTRWHIYLQNKLFNGVDQNLKNTIIEMGRLPWKKHSWKKVYY